MGDTDPLSRKAQKALLRIARDAIVGYLARGTAPRPQTDLEELSSPAGAFVTLDLDEKLRGCIGSIHADSPLFKTVSRMAVAAASDDPRFAPLEPTELRYTEIEISVLSTFESIVPEDVEIGTHGLYLAHGSHRGVLLPQVPVQYGWNRKRFLEEICLKAGVEKKDLRRGDATLEAFTAQVFCDGDFLDDDEDDDDR